MGYTAVLLVEGVTDVLVFKAFLRTLGFEHAVVVLHLGGDALASSRRDQELAEILRLTTDIAAIVDSEAEMLSAPSKARVAFLGRCKALGIKCHLTELRAIENYFGDSLLKRVERTERVAPLKPFESRPSWNKNNNWRLADAMTKAELLETDIGRFLTSWCDETVGEATRS